MYAYILFQSSVHSLFYQYLGELPLKVVTGFYFSNIVYSQIDWFTGYNRIVIEH